MFRRADGSLTPAAYRALRDWGSVAGLVVLAIFLLTAYGLPGFDSFAYWHVDAWSPYHFDGDPGQFGAFRYSPAAAQLLALVDWLPWHVFFYVWLAVLMLALAWLAREWTIAMLAAPFIVLDLYMGNIEVLLAVAIVVGVRRPAAWAFVLLTKVTPGVGLLWFVVRREWRNLAIALAATGLVAGISFALAPSLWFDWPRSLLRVDGANYLPWLTPARLAAAVVIVVWGARTDRPWTLVVAGTLALVWLDPKTLALLAGLGAFLPRTRGAPDGAALEAARRVLSFAGDRVLETPLVATLRAAWAQRERAGDTPS